MLLSAVKNVSERVKHVYGQETWFSVRISEKISTLHLY